MKIRLNPKAIAANNGRVPTVKLFGKEVDGAEKHDVTADKFKIIKGFEISVNGRRMPMWVEVDKPKPADKK